MSREEEIVADTTKFMSRGVIEQARNLMRACADKSFRRQQMLRSIGEIEAGELEDVHTKACLDMVCKLNEELGV